jgi:hypothetical protein
MRLVFLIFKLIAFFLVGYCLSQVWVAQSVSLILPDIDGLRPHVYLKQNGLYVIVRDNVSFLVAIVIAIKLSKVDDKMRTYYWFVGVMAAILVTGYTLIHFLSHGLTPPLDQVIGALLALVGSWYYYYTDDKKQKAEIAILNTPKSLS